MLARVILSATLLFSSAFALPADASTQATQAHPAVNILSQTAARLSQTVGLLDAANGNPAQANAAANQLLSTASGVDAAASQIEQGPGFNIATALSFVPVITQLIAQAKRVTDDVEEKRGAFNPPQMAAALDANYRAVQHLKAAFDSRLPEAFDWVIAGLSDGTLANLAEARDELGGAAPPAYGATYPAAYPAAYGAVPVASAGITAPVYGAAPAYAPRPYRA